ncbi:MAG: hypothetical protein JSS76_12570 [Bacteroidetes bacterium]|nr:hypothetical protein [Bacteroidota bacterium]
MANSESSEEPLLTSNRRDVWRFWIFATVVSILLLYCRVSNPDLFSNVFKGEKFGAILVSIVYGLLLLAGIRLTLICSVVRIYPDRILQKKPFAVQETFPLDQISGWQASYGRGGLNGIWIHFGNRKIHILGTGNIEEFYNFLKERGYPRSKG